MTNEKIGKVALLGLSRRLMGTVVTYPGWGEVDKKGGAS